MLAPDGLSCPEPGNSFMLEAQISPNLDAGSGLHWISFPVSRRPEHFANTTFILAYLCVA